jgi:hypothetical protein
VKFPTENKLQLFISLSRHDVFVVTGVKMYEAATARQLFLWPEETSPKDRSNVAKNAETGSPAENTTCAVVAILYAAV